MDSVIKILAVFALLAVTLAAGIYIVRNGPAIDFNKPASNESDRAASYGDAAPALPKPATFAEPARTTPTIEAGFESLFNGHDLTGWTGSTSEYAVENGSLTHVGFAKPNKGNLYTLGEYADFHLRFDYRLTAGADNGIGIRTLLTGDPAFTGMEIQLQDESHYKKDAPTKSNGSICLVAGAKQGFQKPVGQWNNEDIIARGGHVTVILNGAVIVDADLADGGSNKPHPGRNRTRGHIALMGDTPRVEFRNIRLRDLAAAQ
jgi:hypothetical protein